MSFIWYWIKNSATFKFVKYVLMDLRFWLGLTIGIIIGIQDGLR